MPSKDSYMARIPISGFFILFLFFASPFLSTQADMCFARKNKHLRPLSLGDIDRIYRLRFSRVCKSFGYEVRLARTGRVILAYHSRKPLVSASLTKIFTSFTALKLLGAGYIFETGIRGSFPVGGVINGSIEIYSEGNPFFLASELSGCIRRFVRFYHLKRINGTIFANNSYFFPGVESVCLDGKCSRPYNPVVSPLSLNFNTLTVSIYPGKLGTKARVFVIPEELNIPVVNKTVTIGSRKNNWVSAHLVKKSGKYIIVVSGKIWKNRLYGLETRVNYKDPAGLVKAVARKALEEQGVLLLLQSKLARGKARIFYCSSRSLGDILNGLNRYSNNFMAEVLTRDIGAVVSGVPGTSGKGIRVISRVIRAIGVPSRELHITSGSGLSRSNAASPAAFGRVLAYIFRDPVMSPVFVGSLAVNGQDGTLKRHWKGSRGFVIRGKTGTLSSVVGFSGYIFLKNNYNPLIVTVICNGVKNRWQARRTIESFVVDLVHIFQRRRATKPIIGGNIRLDMNLTPTILTPRIGSSTARTLLSPRSDHADRYATMGPMSAPAFIRDTTIGN